MSRTLADQILTAFRERCAGKLEHYAIKAADQELRHVLDALLLAAPAPRGWQPIETFPENTGGKHFLLYASDNRCTYVGGRTGGEWFIAAQGNGAQYREFTHWQPLPRAPDGPP